MCERLGIVLAFGKPSTMIFMVLNKLVYGDTAWMQNDDYLTVIEIRSGHMHTHKCIFSYKNLYRYRTILCEFCIFAVGFFILQY